ncbi:MAG: EI24 domain-containing protein, partial [Pseudolabrys sp.]
MIDAAIKAVLQMFAPNLRHVLLKAAGLALILITFLGILMQRFLASWAETGANWAEQTTGVAPHAVWSSLAWVLSILAGLGIITGALFLMPAVTAFVGSFFVDEIAEAVEREHYPAEPLGRALPFFLALIEGIKFAALALLIYI